jgi:chromosome partitioning protein
MTQEPRNRKRRVGKSKAVGRKQGQVSPVVRALCEFRRARGFDLDDPIFSAAGLTELTLERLESGVHQPNLDTLERYAEAIGFSLALRRTVGESTGDATLQLQLPRMRVLAMFNHAGGVGKTSLTRDLGHSLGQLGFRVLVIDLDPQANLTSWLGIPRPVADDRTVYYTIVGDEREARLPQPITVHGIDVIPGNLGLHRIDRGGVSGRRRRLERAIRRLGQPEASSGDGQRRYDFVLLDLSPSLTNMTELALVAADHLVVPIPPTDKGIESLPGIIEALENARDDANPNLSIAMFVITQFNQNTAIDQAMIEQLRQHANAIAPVAGPLHALTVYREAIAAAQPINVYAPNHRAVEEIRRVTVELLSVINADEAQHDVYPQTVAR